MTTRTTQRLEPEVVYTTYLVKVRHSEDHNSTEACVVFDTWNDGADCDDPADTWVASVQVVNV